MRESIYKYHVYCNQALIASFLTQHQQQTFIKERKGLYPRNHYGDQPIRF